ncbi:MAG: hypothetical protein A3F46_06380 [Legionellales bacterium RIFCSPHIGHO2_12_FULL_42_9]|nr:MAG: hypothetical protein A3F46_06380 [Legionellales bacterium RIFCSPHIGHO2_12_FULL_42_9]
MLDGLYLAVLLVVAVVIILLPFRKQSIVAWVQRSGTRVPLRCTQATTALLVGFIIFVIVLYGQWGGWVSWQHHQVKQVKSKQMQAILKQFKSTEVLIEKLKQKLDDTPGSAKGWYLLGRLYVSQNDWRAAHDSFQKAIKLAPSQERYRTNDVYVEWMINQRQFNAEIRKNLQSLLQKNPKQPDVLALLAMDAYQQNDYQQAIRYWQALLALAPADSESAKALRRAIARAQRKTALP